jgi:hypothetical protein
MQLARIVLVITPEWEAQDEDVDGDRETRRRFEDVDAFCRVVERCAGVPVEVRQLASLNSLDGTLVLCEQDVVELLAAHLGLAESTVYPRAFFLNVRLRPYFFHDFEQLGAAGAIERLRYLTWLTDRDDDPGGGVFGRTAVAERIGGRCADSALSQTAQNCFFEHADHPTLPDLLAAYLVAYAATI